MRRVGYALFVLAALSVVIALVAFGFSGSRSPGTRKDTVLYGIVNVGFALVNLVLGLVLVAASRAR